MALFQHFWPECPYPVTFYSDRPGEQWCSVVARCAQDAVDDPVLMLLEDFFFTAPVCQWLVEMALNRMLICRYGCLRLYPMPGAEQPYRSSLRIGLIEKGEPHRISCQAAIWSPHYLYEIARNSMGTTGEAGDFENLGTPFSNTLPEQVMAFVRSALPWPMEYLCSAVTRGEWNPDAIKLCASLDVPMDRSMRQVAVA